MRKKSIAWAVLTLAAAGTGVGAYAVAGSGKATRSDCPDTIVCPVTGETVCRDRCPLNGDPRDTPSVSPCCGERAGAANAAAKPAVKEGCCR
jgi:hypothetical protein